MDTFRERVFEFRKELARLEKKHGVTLGHEDSHGSFLFHDDEKPEGICSRYVTEYGLDKGEFEPVSKPW